MGITERRVRDPEETRERILEAAREMFAAQGVAAVTMRAIAKRIGYTPTAIYHHFRDKQELITEICHRDFGALAQRFTRIGRIEDPVERVRRLGLAYVDFAVEHPSHYTVMFMMRTHHDHDRDSRGNPEKDAYALLLHTVQEGIERERFRPEFTDAHELSQILWAGIHGVVSLHIAKGDDPWIEWRDARETSRTMVDVLLRGVVRHPT